MKKTVKMLTTVLLAIMMLFAFAQPVCFAEPSAHDVINSVKNEGNNPLENNTEGGGIGALAGTVIHVLRWAAIIIAVIVIMVIGIQFIIGGTQQKADYKKALIPVAVGCGLIVFGTYIVEFLFSLNGNN